MEQDYLIYGVGVAGERRLGRSEPALMLGSSFQRVTPKGGVIRRAYGRVLAPLRNPLIVESCSSSS